MNWLDRLKGGETVRITRHGKPVAQLVPITRDKQPLPLADLRALIAELPAQAETGEAFIRQLRDDARY